MDSKKLPDMSSLTRNIAEQLKLSMESLNSTIARATDAARNIALLRAPAQMPPAPFVPTHEDVPFLALPETVQYIAGQTAGIDSDDELLKSMLPRTVSAKRVAPRHHQIFLAPIVDRIRWRMKMAAMFGLPFEVFRDERIDANSKTDDLAILRAMLEIRKVESTMPAATKNDIDILSSRQATILDKIVELDEHVAKGVEETKRAASVAMALAQPRPSDYGCSEKHLELILAKLQVKRGERQIRRWEQYLETGGKSGSKPPMDYTLQTRLTIASAMAWAETYAVREKGRLKAKVFFDERRRSHG